MISPLHRERVEAGGKWLNEHCPNWLHRINVEALDVASSTNCILGQLYWHFDHGLAVMGVSITEVSFVCRELGFIVDKTSLRTGDDPYEQHSYLLAYADLTRAWKQYIQEEREKSNDRNTVPFTAPLDRTIYQDACTKRSRPTRPYPPHVGATNSPRTPRYAELLELRARPNVRLVQLR